MYSWSDGETTDTIIVSPRITTIYTLIITDSLGNSDTATQTIAVFNPMVNILDSIFSVCPGSPVTLIASVMDSIARAPVKKRADPTYLWSTGAITDTIIVSPITTTIYSLVGADAFGCSNSASQIINVTIPTTTILASATSICAGSPVTLIANLTDSVPAPQRGSGPPPHQGPRPKDPPATYLWSDGETTDTIVVSPAATITYSVSGTDTNGCAYSASQTINVTGPVVSISASDTVICPGNPVTLIANITDSTLPARLLSATSYLWSDGETTDTIVVSPNSTTTYSLVGTDANGCSSTASQTITISPLISVSILASSDTICSGSPVTLIAIVSQATRVSKADPIWSTGATTDTITVSPTTTTTYSVTATAGNGCNATASQTITVNPNPVISITASATTICTGNSVTLSDAKAVKTESINSYLWSTGATTDTITVSPAITTTYSVTATSGYGCSGTASQTITVNSAPVISIAASSTTICAGSSVTLSDSAVLERQGPSISYLWSDGETTEDITVSPSVTTTYSVTATLGDGCSGSASQTITVNSAPVISIAASATAICAGSSVTLSDNSKNGGIPSITYLWSDGETTENITVSPTVTTTYSVTATLGDGCSGSALQTITVNAITSDCSNAIALSNKHLDTDYSFNSCENALWFSFVADSTKMLIEVTQPVSANDTPFVHLDSLALYSGSCGNLSIMNVSVNNHLDSIDSLPGIQPLNLIIGNTYYIKVTCYPTALANHPSYFGLSRRFLPRSVIPVPCATSSCTYGPPLICNGDFEMQPSWSSGTSYQINSTDFSGTVDPYSGYCIISPNTRWNKGTFASPLLGCNGPDWTDVYIVGTSMGPSTFYNNSAEHGSWFMGVDCPSNYCNECTSSPCAVSPVINTGISGTSWGCIPWEENLSGLTPGATYLFSAWIEDLDVDPSNPGATVSMNCIGCTTSPFFSDQIQSSNGYSSWVQVSACLTPSPAGTGFVTISVSATGGANSTGFDFGLDNISLYAVNTNTITASAAPPSICPNGTSTLTATGGATGTSYTWSPATGLSATTGATVIAAPSTTTTYTVTNCASTAFVTVTVNPLPDVTVSPSTTICPPNSAKLVASGANTYSWSPSIGLSQTTGATVSARPLATTTYTVTGTDAAGCVNTATVTVNVGTTPRITVSPRFYTVCEGTGVNLTAGGGVSYSWSPVSEVSPSTGATITATPTATTTFTVTGTGSDGCTGTATAIVSVDPSLSVSVTSTNACGSGTGSASALVTGGTPPYIYLWSNGATKSSISGLASGIYTVNVTDNICTASATFTVSSEGLPPLPASNYTTCAGICIQIGTATLPPNPNPPYTYTWSPSPGLSCTNCSYPTACPTSTTTYSVTVYDYLTGCSNSGPVTVNVNTNCCSAPIQYTSTLTAVKASQIIAKLGSNVLTEPLVSFDAIGGTFTVDKDYNIVDCPSVAMAKNYTIIVQAPETLTITDSRLFACGEMWTGIIVEPGATLIVNSDGNAKVNKDGQSIIEDATVAIEGQSNSSSNSSSSGTIYVNNSMLNNNYKDIVIDPYNYSSNYPLTLQGSLLTTSLDGGFSGPLLKTPYKGDLTYCGIYLNSVTSGLQSGIIVGDDGASAYLNIFSNMNYGVYALNSNFTVYNNEFDNIQGSGHQCVSCAFCTPCPPPIGIAVFANSTISPTAQNPSYILTIGGSSPNQPNKMINCYRGADITNYYKNSVNNNIMWNSTNLVSPPFTAGKTNIYGDHGIYIKTTCEYGIDINNNRIVNFQNAIHVNGIGAGLSAEGEANVNYNNIYVTNAVDASMNNGVLVENTFGYFCGPYGFPCSGNQWYLS